MKITLTTLALSVCLLGYTTAEPNQDKKKPTAQKIKDLASEIGVIPHMLQAKIWVDIRGTAW